MQVATDECKDPKDNILFTWILSKDYSAKTAKDMHNTLFTWYSAERHVHNRLCIWVLWKEH